MSIVVPFLAILLAGAIVAYHRMRLITWTLVSLVLLAACWFVPYVNQTATIVAAAIVAVIAVPLLLPFIRKPLLTAPMMKVFRKVLPPLSQTERIALETGSVGFEGELFTGDPDWNKLLNYPKPQLTAEEQAFLDGPVEELCAMVNDWEITHVYADLPPELWAFIKKTSSSA
jgi:acyl-CoA dehydrogenase